MQKLGKDERAIMCLLGVAKNEVDGLAIATACRLKRGSIYATLFNMEDKGLIVSRKQDLEDTGGVTPRGGIFKRVYKRKEQLDA